MEVELARTADVSLETHRRSSPREEKLPLDGAGERRTRSMQRGKCGKAGS